MKVQTVGQGNQDEIRDEIQDVINSALLWWTQSGTMGILLHFVKGAIIHNGVYWWFLRRKKTQAEEIVNIVMRYAKCAEDKYHDLSKSTLCC